MHRCLVLLSFFLLFSFDSPNFNRKTIEIDGHKLRVEIADSPIKRSYGLMHREQLNEDEGMLFIFSHPEYIAMWMEETRIPLSVAYFGEDLDLFQIEDMPIERGAPYRLYRSKAPAKYALEVNKGWFLKKGIKPGARFHFVK